MRILNLKEFRSQPNGILFVKYSKEYEFNGSEMQIKLATWECDFVSSKLIEFDFNTPEECEHHLELAEDNSSLSLPLNFEVGCRDGLFEDDQLYAVFEQRDMESMIDVLTKHMNHAFHNSNNS